MSAGKIEASWDGSALTGANIRPQSIGGNRKAPLAPRLQRGQADTAEALRIISRLASLLASAHEAGICQLILSPEQVVLHGEPPGERVGLLDMGIAQKTPEFRGAALGVLGDPREQKALRERLDHSFFGVPAFSGGHLDATQQNQQLVLDRVSAADLDGQPKGARTDHDLFGTPRPQGCGYDVGAEELKIGPCQ